MGNDVVAPACMWSDSTPCQFAGALRIVEQAGRSYCQAHAPMDSEAGMSARQLQEFIETQRQRGACNFDGLVFRHEQGMTYVLHDGNPVTLRHAQFADRTHFHLECDGDLSECLAHGRVTLIQHNRKLTAQSAVFQGAATFATDNIVELILSGSRFSSTVDITVSTNGTKILDCNCQFAKVPQFASPDGIGRLPQNTNFRRARFDRRLAFREGADARFRTLRNRFHENRDREQEGLFYKYEKRAQRKSLGWHPNAWFARAFSALYDWIAGYGQSFERVAFCFFGLQLAAGLCYCIKAGRFHFLGVLDTQAASFTYVQLVRPFEIASGRDLSRYPYEGFLPSEYGGSWIALTGLHTAISLALVALFLLALRWRFRRD